MHWTDPATSEDSHAELEKKLWYSSCVCLRPSPTSKSSAPLTKRNPATFRDCRYRRTPTRLNLTVHGLSGEWSGATRTFPQESPEGERGGAHQIKQGNTYYEDLQDSVGHFDFVMADPPFDVSRIDKERHARDPRYPFGIPRTDNDNHLWIQHFHSALNRMGRAGFVMTNSAVHARAAEQDIWEKITPRISF